MALFLFHFAKLEFYEISLCFLTNEKCQFHDRKCHMNEKSHNFNSCKRYS